MKLFFPDAHDYVDPGYDFLKDEEGPDRQRHRSDAYAHELLDASPYDGLLVSRSIVEGAAGKSGKYTLAQRHRLYREGAHRFFRVDKYRTAEGGVFPIMGDCGAFSYISDPEPPISVLEAIEFYQACGFTHGQSVDHIIGSYHPEWSEKKGADPAVPSDVRHRYQLTLTLADAFIREHRRLGCTFTPVGVAQGWSPTSYATAVSKLQAMGYDFIAIGGLVPLKTPQIKAILQEVTAIAQSNVQLHLLGVLRWEDAAEWLRMGIYSVDTTSPLRQAFLDNRNNYYVPDPKLQSYAAIRVPQSDGNARLKRNILAGEAAVDDVRMLESRCLIELRDYDSHPTSARRARVLDTLDQYLQHLEPGVSRRQLHERSLRDVPWKDCECQVCRELGIEVIIFRGNNRNRRRGFHNLQVTHTRLKDLREGTRCVAK